MARFLILLLVTAGCGHGQAANDVRSTSDAAHNITDATQRVSDSDASGQSDGGQCLLDCETLDAPPMNPAAPKDLAALVQAHRMAEDLAFLAQPRPPASAHWQAVQDECANQFAALGFEVLIEPFDLENHQGVNVIGLKPGTTLPQERVYISAHYDHIAECDGADDNASGVAGVFESARALAHADYERTLAVACWDLEELGLKGSRAHVDGLVESGQVAVTASFVYEMIGYRSMEPGSQEIPPGLDLLFPDEAAKLEANDYKGNFLVVVADSFAHLPAVNLATFCEELTPTPVVLLELDQSQKNSPIFFTLQRSDHGAFWLKDMPAMMLTDTAEYRNKNYHCKDGPDSLERLDVDYAADIVTATVAAAAAALTIAK